MVFSFASSFTRTLAASLNHLAVHRARTNPSRASRRSRHGNSPFCLVTTGASNITRVFVGSDRIRSTIVARGLAVMGSPVTDQWAGRRCEEQAQIIDISWSWRLWSGDWRRSSLFDGMAGRKPFDVIHVRLLHLVEELASVSRGDSTYFLGLRRKWCRRPERTCQTRSSR